eukprot:391397-Prymnesium_polylepis.1
MACVQARRSAPAARRHSVSPMHQRADAATVKSCRSAHRHPSQSAAGCCDTSMTHRSRRPRRTRRCRAGARRWSKPHPCEHYGRVSSSFPVEALYDRDGTCPGRRVNSLAYPAYTYRISQYHRYAGRSVPHQDRPTRIP